MAIDVAAQVQYWKDGSADDLDAARKLLAADKVRQAGFFLHLAIEKAVKACAVAATRDLPPRSHNLLFLAERANLQFSDAQRDFASRVQIYCLEGRYPTELPAPPTKAAMMTDLDRAKEMIEWLTNQLKTS